MVSHFNFPSTLRVICFYALHSPLLCFSYVPRTTSVSQIFVFLDVLHRDMPNVTISNIHLQSCNQMSRRGSVSLNTSKWCTYVRNIDEIKLGASTFNAHSQFGWALLHSLYTAPIYIFSCRYPLSRQWKPSPSDRRVATMLPPR